MMASSWRALIFTLCRPIVLFIKSTTLTCSPALNSHGGCVDQVLRSWQKRPGFQKPPPCIKPMNSREKPSSRTTVTSHSSGKPGQIPSCLPSSYSFLCNVLQVCSSTCRMQFFKTRKTEQIWSKYRPREQTLFAAPDIILQECVDSFKLWGAHSASQTSVQSLPCNLCPNWVRSVARDPWNHPLAIHNSVLLGQPVVMGRVCHVMATALMTLD